MVFTIHDCGFAARLAVEDTGARELRLDKIVRIIRDSRYSIHDISRVELGESKLPRFNMPFEAGLAMGAIRFEPERADGQSRDFLLLDAVPYRDKMTLSDLAGQDPKTHNNETSKIISAVRAFLAAKAREVPVRGATAIIARYESFVRALPKLAQKVEVTIDELNSFDYLPDRIALMVGWLRAR